MVVRGSEVSTEYRIVPLSNLNPGKGPWFFTVESVCSTQSRVSHVLKRLTEHFGGSKTKQGDLSNEGKAGNAAPVSSATFTYSITRLPRGKEASSASPRAGTSKKARRPQVSKELMRSMENFQLSKIKQGDPSNEGNAGNFEKNVSGNRYFQLSDATLINRGDTFSSQSSTSTKVASSQGSKIFKESTESAFSIATKNLFEKDAELKSRPSNGLASKQYHYAKALKKEKRDNVQKELEAIILGNKNIEDNPALKDWCQQKGYSEKELREKALTAWLSVQDDRLDIRHRSQPYAFIGEGILCGPQDFQLAESAMAKDKYRDLLAELTVSDEYKDLRSRISDKLDEHEKDGILSKQDVAGLKARVNPVREFEEVAQRGIDQVNDMIMKLENIEKNSVLSNDEKKVIDHLKSIINNENRRIKELKKEAYFRLGIFAEYGGSSSKLTKEEVIDMAKGVFEGRIREEAIPEIHEKITQKYADKRASKASTGKIDEAWKGCSKDFIGKLKPFITKSEESCKKSKEEKKRKEEEADEAWRRAKKSEKKSTKLPANCLTYPIYHVRRAFDALHSPSTSGK